MHAGVVLGAGLADLLMIASANDVAILEATRPGVIVDVPDNLDPTRRSGHVILDAVVRRRWNTSSAARLPTRWLLPVCW